MKSVSELKKDLEKRLCLTSPTAAGSPTKSPSSSSSLSGRDKNSNSPSTPLRKSFFDPSKTKTTLKGTNSVVNPLLKSLSGEHQSTLENNQIKETPKKTISASMLAAKAALEQKLGGRKTDSASLPGHVEDTKFTLKVETRTPSAVGLSGSKSAEYSNQSSVRSGSFSSTEEGLKELPPSSSISIGENTVANNDKIANTLPIIKPPPITISTLPTYNWKTQPQISTTLASPPKQSTPFGLRVPVMTSSALADLKFSAPSLSTETPIPSSPQNNQITETEETEVIAKKKKRSVFGNLFSKRKSTTPKSLVPPPPIAAVDDNSSSSLENISSLSDALPNDNMSNDNFSNDNFSNDNFSNENFPVVAVFKEEDENKENVLIGQWQEATSNDKLNQGSYYDNNEKSTMEEAYGDNSSNNNIELQENSDLEEDDFDDEEQYECSSPYGTPSLDVASPYDSYCSTFMSRETINFVENASCSPLDSSTLNYLLGAIDFILAKRDEILKSHKVTKPDRDGIPMTTHYSQTALIDHIFERADSSEIEMFLTSLYFFMDDYTLLQEFRNRFRLSISENGMLTKSSERLVQICHIWVTENCFQLVEDPNDEFRTELVDLLKDILEILENFSLNDLAMLLHQTINVAEMRYKGHQSLQSCYEIWHDKRLKLLESHGTDFVDTGYLRRENTRTMIELIGKSSSIVTHDHDSSVTLQVYQNISLARQRAIKNGNRFDAGLGKTPVKRNRRTGKDDYRISNRMSVMLKSGMSTYDRRERARPKPAHMKVSFLDLNPVEVARQLTLIEEENFRFLTPLDFIKRGRNESTPRLTAIVDQFERVSYWVCTEICMLRELSDRIETLQRFLHIAKLCWDWQNFSSCMAICGALNMNAVTRLILTWQGIDTECRKFWEFLKEVTSVENCFGVYRQTALSCSGPGIPFSGSHTQTAYLCQERYKDRQPGMYNVKRLKVFSDDFRIVNRLINIGGGCYQFDFDYDTYKYLKCDIPVVKESEMLERMSKTVEPPELQGQLSRSKGLNISLSSSGASSSSAGQKMAKSLLKKALQNNHGTGGGVGGLSGLEAKILKTRSKK